MDDVTNMFWDLDDSSQIRVRNELVKTFRMDLKAFVGCTTNFSSVDNLVRGWRRMVIDWNSRIGDFASTPGCGPLWECLSGIHFEVMNTTTFIHAMDRNPCTPKEGLKTMVQRFINHDHLFFLCTCLEYKF
jgi:hypothetical protein